MGLFVWCLSTCRCFSDFEHSSRSSFISAFMKPSYITLSNTELNPWITPSLSLSSASRLHIMWTCCWRAMMTQTARVSTTWTTCLPWPRPPSLPTATEPSSLSPSSTGTTDQVSADKVPHECFFSLFIDPESLTRKTRESSKEYDMRLWSWFALWSRCALTALLRDVVK